MNRLFRHNLVSAGSRLALCAMMALPSAPSLALGLFGDSDEPPLPQITLARTEVAAEIPTPLQGNDMQALLAQATSGEGLAAVRDAATRAFNEQLQSKLDRALREFFAEEQVELVASNHSLTLHNFIDISIVKQLSGLKSSENYELERGNLSASGDFHFRLQAPGGKVLIERRLDIAELRLKASYQIKTYNNGQAAEDSTPAELEKLTENLVARILDRIEDDLEADSLRDIAGG